MTGLSRREILQDRAAQLARARTFFAERNVLEVDTPALSKATSVDLYIDPLAVQCCNETAYLHTSPEYRMKRLLSEGIGDIYQLGHVYRDFEHGNRHSPEFTMAEWYRCDFTFQQCMQETLDFIKLFIPVSNTRFITYKEAFEEFLHFDPFTISDAELQQKTGQQFTFRDDHLSYLLAMHIEPHLGANKTCAALYYYPPSQAALAKVVTFDANKVAERFEIYYQGIELANGYHELQDPAEQRARLVEANELRRSIGKPELPIDEEFLDALHRGLPETCGVSVGFDRCMMLRHELPTLTHAIAFPYQ